MKIIKNIFLSIVLTNLIPLFVFSQATKEKEEPIEVTPKDALQVKNDQFQNVKEIASPLFDPVTTSTPPKPNTFPTPSINE